MTTKAPRPDYTQGVLIEGVDGGPPTQLPLVVQPLERKFSHAGVSYEHCADHVDGRWIYRAM